MEASPVITSRESLLSAFWAEVEEESPVVCVFPVSVVAGGLAAYVFLMAEAVAYALDRGFLSRSSPAAPHEQGKPPIAWRHPVWRASEPTRGWAVRCICPS